MENREKIMENREKIVLIVGGNFVNKGAQLMISTVISVLKSYDSMLVPVIVDSFPLKKRRDYYCGAMVLSVPFYLNFGYSIFKRMNYSLKFIARTIRHALSRVKWRSVVSDFRDAIKMLKLCKNAICVIDISGYGYKTSGIYSDSMSYIQLVFASIASSASIPYFYFPQSFGPFVKDNKQINIKLHPQIRSSIENAAQVFVREKKSMVEISNLLGVNHGTYWPDIALLYAPHAQKILPAEIDVATLNSSILIIPNVRLYDKYSESKVDWFYYGLISFSLNKNYNVVVLRHSGDDAYIINKIQSRFAQRVVILNQEYETEVIDSIIAASRLVVSGRYHGLVVSLRNSVPCIATGWSHKYDELMNLYGLDDYLIDISISACVENVSISLVNALEDRNKLIARIDAANTSLLSKYPLSRFVSFMECKQSLDE